MTKSHVQSAIHPDDTTPALTPGELIASHPVTDDASNAIIRTRQEVIRILQGQDDRLIAIVGPCSEDDSLQPDGTPSVVEFAKRLKDIIARHELDKSLLVIMRCPPAKPRSNLGMRGLEQSNLKATYGLLADIANLGVPLAIEVMNEKHIARYGSLISLAWIGARNQDTTFRHTLSLFPDLPVLCKNGETGSLDIALASIETIAASHANAEIMTPDGRTAHVRKSPGNPNTGIIWRGGKDYMSHEGFEKGLKETVAAGKPYAVDCAHGNEQAHDANNKKSVEAQLACFDHLLEIMGTDNLSRRPSAVMIEAYLQEGADTSGGTPGKSLTDPCVSIDQLESMLVRLSKSR